MPLTILGMQLPLVLRRSNATRPAIANERLAPGDEVTFIRERSKANVEAEHFDQLASGATIIDLDEAMDLDQFLETVTPLLASEMREDKDAIIHAYRTRELSSGTVLGQGVAIPHIMLEGENRSHLLVVRARGGVTFVDADEPVHILFVMATAAVSSRAAYRR
jgi:mannitol/fructose-specific phosphotransferase system IIA component (Ntr-type)